MRNWKEHLLFGVFVAFAGLVYLMVTIQPAPAYPAELQDKPITFNTELSIISLSGNSSANSIGLKNNILLKLGIWNLSNRMYSYYSKSNGVVSEEKYGANIRAESNVGLFYGFYPLNPYYEFSWDRNLQAGLEARYSGSFGFSAKAESLFHYIAGELAAIVRAEDRLGEDGKIFPVTHAQVHYYFKVIEKVRAGDKFGVDSDLNTLANHILGNEVYIQVQLNNYVSFKYSHEITYRGEPISGFLNTDQKHSLKIGLKW